MSFDAYQVGQLRWVHRHCVYLRVCVYSSSSCDEGATFLQGLDTLQTANTSFEIQCSSNALNFRKYCSKCCWEITLCCWFCFWEIRGMETNFSTYGDAWTNWWTELMSDEQCGHVKHVCRKRSMSVYRGSEEQNWIWKIYFDWVV